MAKKWWSIESDSSTAFVGVDLKWVLRVPNRIVAGVISAGATRIFERQLKKLFLTVYIVIDNLICNRYYQCMETLESLAQQNQTWTLEQFVEIINRLLPKYLPIVKANTRVREEINPRLVRHYTSQGLLDEPHKQGKYAYYTYRHLLQILVIRRLGSEGVSSATMGQFIPNKKNIELENLLNGGMQIQINPANPALAFLQSVKSRPHTTCSSISLQSNQFSDFTPFEQNLWTHIEIVPGLEVHLHSDFSYPDSPNSREFLKQQILQALEEYIKHKQGKI